MDQNHLTIKQEAFNDETENSGPLLNLWNHVKKETFDDLEAVAHHEVIPVKKEESYEIEFYEEPVTKFEIAGNSDSDSETNTDKQEDYFPLGHTKEKPHQCKECGRCFSKNTDLVRHIRVHTGEKPFECEDCGKKFSHKYTLDGHIRAAHTGDKPFKCEDCGRKFSQKGSLNRHRYAVHASDGNNSSHACTKPQRHYCKVCGKCFLTNTLLVRHLRVHTEEKPFKCEECGKEFSEKCNLEKHILFVCGTKSQIVSPTKKPPHQCKYCGKCFTRRADLVRHIRVHTGEKPFKCGECGKTFSNNYTVKEHNRAVHTRDKPFQCDDCGMKFSQKSSLQRHRHSVHIGKESCGRKLDYNNSILSSTKQLGRSLSSPSAQPQ